MDSVEARLARLEEQVHEIRRGWTRLETTLAETDRKLDRLLELASLGRGAFRALLRLGGILLAVLTAVGVLGIHLRWPFGGH